MEKSQASHREVQTSSFLFLVQLIQQVPDPQHILDSQGPVIFTIAWSAYSRAFLPELPSMVRADISFPACVMVGPKDIDDSCLATAVPVGGFREVSIREVMDIPDVGESDPLAMLPYYFSTVVIGICIKASCAECKAVIWGVHHF